MNLRSINGGEYLKSIVINSNKLFLSDCRKLHRFYYFDIYNYFDSKAIKYYINNIEKFSTIKIGHKKHDNEYVIIHPSTKRPGKIQLTYFDENGPYSDIQRDTLYDIVEVIFKQYTILKESIL